MRLSGAAIGALLGVAAGVPVGAAPAEPPLPAVVREVATGVGLDDTDLGRVWRGEIVARSLDGPSDRDLTVAVVMRLRESHREFYERVSNGQLFEVDRTVLHAEEIPAGASGPSVFASLELDREELDRLGKAAPGTDYNLSRGEIEELKGAAKAADDAVLTAYRGVLSERLRAYRAEGIGAVDAYARRGADDAAPARDLRAAISSLVGLDARCPSFYRAFSSYPDRADPGVSHRFFWVVQKIEDRPSVILSHWALQLHEEFAVVGERQFYVGRGYDALQIVVGAFSIAEDDSLVFYVNRTSTDRVTGFGSKLARSLGQKVMLREILALFRDLRASATAR